MGAADPFKRLGRFGSSAVLAGFLDAFELQGWRIKTLRGRPTCRACGRNPSPLLDMLEPSWMLDVPFRTRTPQTGPELDHGELFAPQPRDRGTCSHPVVLAAHPYNETGQEALRLRALDVGLTYRRHVAGSRLSWYAPGRTELVLIGLPEWGTGAGPWAEGEEATAAA